MQRSFTNLLQNQSTFCFQAEGTEGSHWMLDAGVLAIQHLQPLAQLLVNKYICYFPWSESGVQRDINVQ